MHQRATPDDADREMVDDVQTASRIGALPAILDVACHITGMGFAVLAKVTDNRWTACAARDQLNTGVEIGDRLDVETTICHDVRRLGRPVVVNDAATDDVYRHHSARLVFGFNSFISVPVILADGTFFGTLSALDPAPRALDTAASLASFTLLAQLVAFHLDKELQVTKSRTRLAEERHAAELRERFICVLGHDLRNPLASIQTGTWILRHQPDFAADVAELIEESLGRMTGLLDDVLDFARGRLGTGLPINLHERADLATTIAQVVQDARTARPNRQIETDFALKSPVTCDLDRIAQLLSNLLGNALAHGDPASPVLIQSACVGRHLEICVSNQGSPIPEQALSSLFQPFVRASSVPAQQGLGLGLFIAAQIARDHGGSLGVQSDEAETRFTFRMPLDQADDP